MSSAPGDVLACLSLHAERLERDDVWRAVHRVLDLVERRGVRATFFVHPLTAIRAGFDLHERLVELRDRGHEIAQHTHFYSTFEETSSGVHKVTSLDERTISACIDRDRTYLRDAGFTPRGFVAGGWAIAPGLFDHLAQRGFAYDCSYRTYALAYANEPGVAGDDAVGPFRSGSIVEIPTTATLSDEIRCGLRRNARTVGIGGSRYRLSYLHDTDLLEPKKFHGLARLRPIAVRGSSHVTAGEIAQRAVTALRTGAPDVG